ncbi:TIGR00730 family Rossman fold protein [Phenylobacterium sp.]|uniref:LOG family protein n=1 Tax=Phenylobacterium sp. TaxID=1871053 RepID=UPI0035AEEB3B
MGDTPERLESVCVFCGSSDAAAPALLASAADFGAILAREGLTMIYGGGGVGLMGACAQAAHEAGGKVLGIIPHFLKERERRLDIVETVVVDSMHERKMMMFERTDGFVVLPGGIGTLEEVVELLSWRRLDLHGKPVVFYNPDGFWEPLFNLFQHTVDQNLTPPSFMESWVAVETIEQIVPALRRDAPSGPDAATDVAQLT